MKKIMFNCQGNCYLCEVRFNPIEVTLSHQCDHSLLNIRLLLAWNKLSVLWLTFINSRSADTMINDSSLSWMPKGQTDAILLIPVSDESVLNVEPSFIKSAQ